MEAQLSDKQTAGPAPWDRSLEQDGKLAEEIANRVLHHLELRYGPSQQVDPRHPTGREQVFHRLVDRFPELYLTLASVIQGVALGFLATELSGKSAHMTLTTWLEAVTMLFVIVVAWNEYAVFTLPFAWVPTFMDSILPFLVGASELLAIRAIGPHVTEWLGACALIPLVGLVNYRHTYWRASQDHQNRYVLATLLSPWLSYAGTAIGASGCAALWLLSCHGLLADTSPVGPALVCTLVMATVIGSVLNWLTLLRHAMGHMRGTMPEHSPASTAAPPRPIQSERCPA